MWSVRPHTFVGFGEQYLALNLLGSEQKLAAYSIVIRRNENLNPGDLERLLPLPGSPYAWRNRYWGYS